MFHRKRHPNGLPADEAESRIRKMVAFILNDAHDKADEIKAQTQQDALRLYQQRVTEAEQQLRREYDEKRRRAEAEYRRRQGQRLVEAELQVQRMRWEKVWRIQHSLYQRLTALCQPSDVAYATFLAYLMAEGLLSVANEDRIQLRYREEDAPLMEAVKEQGVKIATATLRCRAGVERSWRVELADGEWLPPRRPVAVEGAHEQDSDRHMLQLQQQHADAKSLGGLILLADRGRIRVNNTVDHRLTRTVHALLPVIRAMLWGDDKGYVHRMVEQRRGKHKSGKRQRVVRWEKHEAHIIAVEEDVKAEGEPEGKEGTVRGVGGEDREEETAGKEEKESEPRWWREHEPELKVPPPTWSVSDRNTREEQLADRKDTVATQQQQAEQKQP